MTGGTRDPYLVLGVRPVDGLDAIKQAYRRLSLEYHPDRNKGREAMAAARMKELVAAYEILKDRQKRKDYDEQPFFQPRSPRGRGKVAPGVLARARKKKKKKAAPSFWDRMKKALFGEQPRKVDPEAADAHFSLGMTLVDNASFYADAREEFQEALENDPNFLEAAYNLGLMHYKLGDYAEARAAFQRVLQIQGEDRAARTLLDLLRDAT